ncbi:diadenylate cyclase [Geotalea daltonii FRC-32]|uniref:Diadenylate cyclase n=1 Tax=Geotalea daltonii (strain DSM 22248 / JCM 15807 / FRC-32) TaxID=316067 RepID=B9M5K5_GEODF|nr:diadenylate cyclase [Geotalea daltonii FRC-32]
MTEFPQNLSLILQTLDIALAAFVIYRLSLLINGALAVRILASLSLLLIFSMAARLAGLHTVHLLLKAVIASSFVALVVIFQTDIRLAFATMNRGRQGKEREVEEVDSIIEELATAAESLAGRQIGALIVIERSMSIDNFIAVGTDIDAKVTSELISSIFLPYSPIHDGAVIIQKGKLTRAGCFLPLTQNPDISKNLGTRHRAAIGLTELVDAVVLVVSEETGSISLVVGGHKSDDLDSITLRKVLRKLIEPRWLS